MRPPGARASTAISETVADEDLLGRIGLGEIDAVGLLYDRYIPVLFPLAVRIIRDRAEAEDLVHDAFVLVNDRARQYTRDLGTVAAWLITLVRNLSIDRVRRRDRRGVLRQQIYAHEPVHHVADPEMLTSLASDQAHVRMALATLPDIQRAILETAFYEGLSYPEIAAREGVPVGTVKSRSARAIVALRASLHRSEFNLRA
jgi:RNA polymerase sigma-70 factor (ECF subfamily)